MDVGGLPTRSPRPGQRNNNNGITRSMSLGTRFVLVAGKASRVAAVFLSFEFLTLPLLSANGKVLTTLPLPIFLFLVMTGAAITLLALQKPWRGRGLGKAKFKDVFFGGSVLALTLYVYSAGLRACGPLRTLLLDGSELPMLYAFSVCTGRDRSSKRRTRGLLLTILAYALVLYDASGRESGDAAALAHTKFGMKAEKALRNFRDGAEARLGDVADNLKGRIRRAESVSMRRLLAIDNSDSELVNDGTGFGDVQNMVDPSTEDRMVLTEAVLRIELGVVLVLFSSVITLLSSRYRKQLATKIGGAKRSFALSVSMAALTLLPFACVSLYRESERFNFADVRLRSVGNIMGTGILWIVLPYYIRAHLTSLLSHSIILRAAPINFLLGASLATFTGFGTITGSVSLPLVLSFFFNVMGLHSVSSSETLSGV